MITELGKSPKLHPPRWPLRWLLYFLPGLIAVPTALTAGLSRDEQMYVTAASLVRDHSLYREFAYFQMPYFPFIQAPFLVLAGDHHLLALRLLAALSFWALDLVLYFLVLRFTGSWRMGVAAAALLLCSETALLAAGIATNHIPALLFLTIAVLCVVSSMRRSERSSLWVLTGVALGLAVGVRLTYLAYLPVLVIFLVGVSPASRIKAGGRMMLGFGAALSGALLIFARDPAAFWFNNIQYHLANVRWHAAMGHEITMTWPSKLHHAVKFLEDSSHLPLLITAVVCTGVLIYQGRLASARRVGVSAGIFFYSLVLAILPRPVPHLYFLPVVPALIVWAIASVHALAGSLRKASGVLLILCVLIAMGDAFGDLRDTWSSFVHPREWTPTRVRAEIEPHRQVIESRSVATISPIHALEAGAHIPLEFSTGPFFYRVGDSLSDSQRKRFHGSSPSTVAVLLDALRPAALLTGVDRNSGGWDLPLIDWAGQNQYEALRLGGAEQTLWLGPRAGYSRTTPAARSDSCSRRDS